MKSFASSRLGDSYAGHRHHFGLSETEMAARQQVLTVRSRTESGDADYAGSNEAAGDTKDGSGRNLMGLFSKLFNTGPKEPQDRFEVTSTLIRPPRQVDDRYAVPENYKPLPVLTLRKWDYGKGLEPGSEGFGFTTPDGKIWPAGKCKWEYWSELGVLRVKVVGESFHLDDLQSPEFAPGKSIRLTTEPENPVDSKAIAIKSWDGTFTAGYIKQGNTQRLRNLLSDQAFSAMVLSTDSYEGKRQVAQIVVFRPGRVRGCEKLPAHPPLTG